MRTLIPLIEGFPNASVYVVGDVMLDVFVFGCVDRISPEAPVPILKIEHTDEMLGGAGNVVRNLISLGCSVCFSGSTGVDKNGDKIEVLLNQLKGLRYHLQRTPFPSIVKTRYVSNNQQVLRTDVEQKVVMSSELENNVLEHFRSVIGEMDVLVIADYDKGTMSPSLTQRIISLACQENIPVLVDPKGRDYTKYMGATLVKPNLKELRECFPNEIIEGTELAYLRKLAITVKSKYALLTRGKQGMALYDGETIKEIEALKKDIFDVSGAGDSVIATIAAAYATGLSMEHSVQLGNIAGGIVVGKPGTAVVTTNELIQEIHVTRKIYSLSALQDLVDYWKRNDYSIGFTNGCFDLLHQGHISLLKFAKRNCDKLIVALNSDDSVKALKGKSRPIKDQNERALIISEFNCVDGVVIFDDPTPESIIHLLRPDVLVKGGDYAREEIIGSSFVTSYGGRVLTSEYLPGYSSTKIVNLIANS